MTQTGIIGGGIAGLSTAYRLVRAGHNVTLFEKSPILGGLASSFDFDGQPIERYYHFICTGDDTLLSLVHELGLGRAVRWRHTKMGLFYDNKLHPFGEPWDLLLFPGFGIIDKIRFGLATMATKTGSDGVWKGIEDVPVEEWLVSRFGRRAYEVVHKPLIELKFGEHAGTLSAAWMWARINRLGRSRTKLSQREILGYIEGGTTKLVEALVERIQAGGGRLVVGRPVEEVLAENGRVVGVVSGDEKVECDRVISTVPFPVVRRLLPRASGQYFEKVAGVKYIGVMCTIMRLRRSETGNFWTNISHPGVNLAGIVEYTNLNPCPQFDGDSIVYVPQYLPAESERYNTPDERLLEEYERYLKLVNPAFRPSWVRSYRVFRDPYAQPICEVGFTRMTPEIQTPIQGLYVTDSSQLHPDDRTISNSVGLGSRAACLALAEAKEKENEGNRSHLLGAL